MNMLYGRYRFSCRLETRAILPPYKGSTFRGVLGRSLKRVVCALKRQPCEDCLLKERCLYTRVFETALSVEKHKGGRSGEPPHPFVIEPPLTTRTEFSAGEAFEFHLLLFGEVNSSLPYFVYAFEQMGKKGIGRKVNGERGRFCLEEVGSQGETVFNAEERTIRRLENFEDLRILPPSKETDEAVAIKVHLETPLRLKFNNRLARELPFHVLVRGALRRVSSLMDYYDNEEPLLDYRGMVQRASLISIVDRRVQWHDWRRYSFRQDQAMLLGGMLGSVTYEGKLGEFIPLIELCSKIHLGKQTSFGLGKIRVEILK